MTIIPRISCYLVTPPSLISFGIGVFVGNYRSAITDEDFKKIWNREGKTFSLDYGHKKVSERKKTDKVLLSRFTWTFNFKKYLHIYIWSP